MNADEIRAIQAPLKQLYRDKPEAARVASHAVGTLDTGDVAVTMHTQHGEVTAGLHKACGGSGQLACSADMLLEALVACAGVTFRAVATAMGVTVRRGKITAEGIWDVRGTLGVSREVPVGVTEISMKFDVDCDADPAKLERMVQATERYCVIFQTLKSPPRLSISIGS